jgi:hypothetical protein
MKRTRRIKRAWLGLAVAGSLLGLPLFAPPAHAIIGRPLTPFSYAGVARRTTRRAVMYGGAYGGAPMAPYPYPYYW